MSRLALLALAALAVLPAQAQYALRADVVASGATNATGGGYTLRGTVAEAAVVGPVAGGAYGLGQGFWYPAAGAGGAGPLVDLTLTVLDPPPPVQLPRGEILRYRADFAIAANGPSQFQYWAEVTLPNNQVRFLFGPITVNGTPGTTASVTLQQRVPNAAPLGDYVFRMMVGEHPGTVYDTDSFPLTVIAGETLAARDAGRRVTGGAVARRAPVTRSDTARRAASAEAVPARDVPARDVPAEVARRLAASPEAWLAWDADGAILEAGHVQDLRRAAGRGETARRDTTVQAGSGDGRSAAAPEAVGGAHATTVPAAVVLAPPSPNPSAGVTTLRFGLPAASAVRLVVYDALGRRLAVLAEGAREAGWHAATFDASSLPAGVYVARLEADGVVLARRLTLLR